VNPELAQRQCVPRSGAALARAAALPLLAEIPSWVLNDSNTEIHRVYHFQDYYETMAFVNAVAWIAHQQDHHPDLEVGYNRCTVHFSTHSVGGLSENDFICAARINALQHS
jgi:4a-hydroxytetrahydrobiopterin dehydratase